MQDLQKLTDKLNLLEDLVSHEDDATSLQGLLQNPAIQQMYQNCRNELPKLLELTNSDGLNEDLMNRIINITERLMKIKAQVESNGTEKKNEIELLNQSSDQLSGDIDRNYTNNTMNATNNLNIFDDLPLLSPNPNNTNTKAVVITQKSFKYTNDLLVDSIQLPDQLITRIMNISSKQLINLKLNGKVVKSALEPFETFITAKSDLKSIEYNDSEIIEFTEISEEKIDMENLLLI